MNSSNINYIHNHVNLYIEGMSTESFMTLTSGQCQGDVILKNFFTITKSFFFYKSCKAEVCLIKEWLYIRIFSKIYEGF